MVTWGSAESIDSNTTITRRRPRPDIVASHEKWLIYKREMSWAGSRWNGNGAFVEKGRIAYRNSCRADTSFC